MIRRFTLRFELNDFTMRGNTGDSRQNTVNVKNVHVMPEAAIAVFFKCGHIFLNPIPGEFKFSRPDFCGLKR